MSPHERFPAADLPPRQAGPAISTLEPGAQVAVFPLAHYRPVTGAGAVPAGRHRPPGRGRAKAVVAGLVAVAAAVTGIAVASGADSATVLVEDRFDRSVPSGWGVAPSGGAYSATAPPTGLSVNGGATVVLPAERSGRSVWLPSVSTLDVSARADVTFPAAPGGFGQAAAVTLRKIGRQQSYLARARYAGDRSVRIALFKIVAGRPDQRLGPELVVGRSMAPGVRVALAAGVSGGERPTLVAAAWIGGTAQPTSWQLRYTDDTAPLVAAGAVGMWFYAGSGQTGPTPIQVSALSAVDQVPAGPPTGTELAAPAPSLPTLAPLPTAPSPAPSTAAPSPSTSAPTEPGEPSPPAGTGGRPSSTAGAPPLGSTSYPVPADAIVVSPTGSDSAAGTTAAPFRTINRAVSAAALGATIVLRAGTYHESVQVLPNRRVTLQNWPGEAVWLDGSTVVGSWIQDGSAWRHDGWTPRFDSSIPYVSSPDFDMIDPAYPMAAHPEQMWINGRPLRQVGSRAQVVEGTFFVDTAAARLYIGSSPVGQEVRATDLAEAIYLNETTGSVVRGLGVRRYATPVLRMGTVKAYGDNDVIADMHIESSATTGLSVTASNVRVERNTIRASGDLGIHSNESDGLVLRDNLVVGSNTEHFAEIPVAGGIKVTRSRGITLARNAVLDNGSTGIWLDESVYDAKVVSNDVRGNTRHGVYFELSAKALIADNVVVDNGGSGIRVADSSGARIWNNTVLRNGMAVDVQDGPRVATDLSIPGHDRRQPLPDPTVTWVVQDVEVRNNVLDVGTRTGVRCLFRAADDSGSGRTAAQMGITGDYDLYVRPSASQLPTVVAWAGGSTTRAFGSVDAFRSGTGQEARGLGIEAPTTSVLATPDADLRLRADSPAKGKGAALPADVAAAIGRPAGGPVDPGAFFG
jgi:parallel beta-helix repeat protein